MRNSFILGAFSAVLFVAAVTPVVAAPATSTFAYGPFKACPPTETQPVPACVAYPAAKVPDDELAAWMKKKKKPLPPATTNPGDVVDCGDFKDTDKRTVDWARANAYFLRYAAFGDPASLDRGNKAPGPADTANRENLDEDPVVTGIAGIPCESLAGAPKVRRSQLPA